MCSLTRIASAACEFKLIKMVLTVKALEGSITRKHFKASPTFKSPFYLFSLSKVKPFFQPGRYHASEYKMVKS
ncbi:Uncharacterized protein TCM_026506 [Theobroma cacao]|uniref:Uncharacterized protein n=1 Tax=Theobroma cacao TaxID=3641 RepID=A0A061F2J3_THECC|nr:Uncharacterized protein TCM_026506 [Theobroma cacao]